MAIVAVEERARGVAVGIDQFDSRDGGVSIKACVSHSRLARPTCAAIPENSLC